MTWVNELNICDNLADYMSKVQQGHAANALPYRNGREFAGRRIIAEFSPVTDFREAMCRQYEENVCNRGGYCNFMHLKKIVNNEVNEMEISQHNAIATSATTAADSPSQIDNSVGELARKMEAQVLE